MPKKKLQDELKEGKAVDTQAVVAEIRKELDERNEELAKANRPSGFVVYAEFNIGEAFYVPGDMFAPPAGWTRDNAYDEFRGIQVKNKAGKEIGTAFNTPSGLQIVPVKEA